MRDLDSVDLRLLEALESDPRRSLVALADDLKISRNTVYSRLARLEEEGAFLSFDRRISLRALGHPVSAFMTLTVRQRDLRSVVQALADLPEVLQVHGLSGTADLLALVAAPDIESLFSLDGEILAIDGVERTETALSMGELVPYRVQPLIRRALEAR